MRGRNKIMIALIALVILVAPLTVAGDEFGLPTDKTASGFSFQLVRFDGVLYRVVSDVPCALYFYRIDGEHHLLHIKPLEALPSPYCEVSVQWGNFPPIMLGLEAGDTNSWILGTETGYAEK
jgi:hypothetical protein